MNNNTYIELPIESIIWCEDLYPRFEPIPEIPEIGHVRIGNKIHLNLGSATCGDCPEHLKSLYAGYIEKSIIYLVGSVARHFYLVYRERLTNDVENEDNIRDNVIKLLKRQGWTVEKESYTSQGRIDILARNATEIRIIEVKKDGKSNSMAHALGQLLFYSKFYPSADLWVHSPEKPDLTILSILDSFNVNYLEVDSNA